MCKRQVFPCGNENDILGIAVLALKNFQQQVAPAYIICFVLRNRYVFVFYGKIPLSCIVC